MLSCKFSYLLIVPFPPRSGSSCPPSLVLWNSHYGDPAVVRNPHVSMHRMEWQHLRELGSQQLLFLLI